MAVSAASSATVAPGLASDSLQWGDLSLKGEWQQTLACLLEAVYWKCKSH